MTIQVQTPDGTTQGRQFDFAGPGGMSWADMPPGVLQAAVNDAMNRTPASA
jgi:hypothetical protein